MALHHVMPWVHAHFPGWKMGTHHTTEYHNACCQGACPCCRANHPEAVGRCDVCIDIWELSAVSTSFFAAVVEHGRGQPRAWPRLKEHPYQTSAISHNEAISHDDDNDEPNPILAASREVVRFIHVGGVRIRRIHGVLHDGLRHSGCEVVDDRQNWEILGQGLGPWKFANCMFHYICYENRHRWSLDDWRCDGSKWIGHKTTGWEPRTDIVRKWGWARHAFWDSRRQYWRPTGFISREPNGEESTYQPGLEWCWGEPDFFNLHLLEYWLWLYGNPDRYYFSVMQHSGDCIV